MKSAYAEVRCFMLILFLHFGLYVSSVFLVLLYIFLSLYFFLGAFFFETYEKTLGFAFQTEPRLRNLLFYSLFCGLPGAVHGTQNPR